MLASIVRERESAHSVVEEVEEEKQDQEQEQEEKENSTCQNFFEL